MRQVGLFLCLLMTGSQTAAVGPLPRDDDLPAQAVARFGSTISAVSRWNRNVLRLARDGKTLAIVESNEVRLIDTNTSKEKWKVRLPNSGYGFGQIAFSGKSHRFAILERGNVQVHEVATGKLLRTIKAGPSRNYRGIALSHDGAKLAIIHENGSEEALRTDISLWNLTTGVKDRDLPLGNLQGASATFSPTGKQLVACGVGKTKSVQVWATEQVMQNPLWTQDGKYNEATFSPDGTRLILAESPGGIRVWDTTQWKQLHRFLSPPAWWMGLAVSRDGQTLATRTNSGAVQFWDLVKGERLDHRQGPHGGFIQDLTFLPDKTVVVAGSRGQTIDLWDAPSGRLRMPGPKALFPISTLAFQPDGKTLLACDESGLLAWDIASGKCTQRVACWNSVHHHTDASQHLSHDGTYWLKPSSQNDLHLVTAATGQEIALLGSGQTSLATIQMSHDSLLLVQVVHQELEKVTTAHLWDLARRREVRKLTLATEPVVVALSPRGKRLALVHAEMGKDPRLSVLGFANGNIMLSRPLRVSNVSSASFSPDGRLLAVLGNKVEVWDVTLGVTKAEAAPEEKQLGPFVFSPDSRSAAFADNTRGIASSVVLWELATGKVRTRFAGHRGAVTALAFSPDGRTLATGGEDTTVMLWGVSGVQARVANPDIAAWWADLAFDDGPRSHLAMCRLTAHPDQTLRLFRKELQPAPGKGLSASEVKQFLGQVVAGESGKWEKAAAALRAGGYGQRGLVAEALNSSTDVAVKARLGPILKSLVHPGSGPAGELRSLRALEVLERIGDVEARRLVAEIARGNPDSHVTQDALNTQRRMAARK